MKYINQEEDIYSIIKHCTDKIKEQGPLKKHMELEFRLGFFNESGFNTDIPQHFYDKIKNIMDNTNVWENTEDISVEDHHWKKYRLSEYENGDEICIQKENIFNVDIEYESSPFDLRISLNKETPTKVDKFNKSKSEFVRKKNRKRYNYKYIYYDFTKVQSEYNTLISRSNNIEIEIKDIKTTLKDYCIEYLLHSCILKIRDFVRMCENCDNSKFKLKTT